MFRALGGEAGGADCKRRRAKVAAPARLAPAHRPRRRTRWSSPAATPPRSSCPASIELFPDRALNARALSLARRLARSSRRSSRSTKPIRCGATFLTCGGRARRGAVLPAIPRPRRRATPQLWPRPRQRRPPPRRLPRIEQEVEAGSCWPCSALESRLRADTVAGDDGTSPLPDQRARRATGLRSCRAALARLLDRASSPPAQAGERRARRGRARGSRHGGRRALCRDAGARGRGRTQRSLHPQPLREDPRAMAEMVNVDRPRTTATTRTRSKAADDLDEIDAQPAQRQAREPSFHFDLDLPPEALDAVAAERGPDLSRMGLPQRRSYLPRPLPRARRCGCRGQARAGRRTTPCAGTSARCAASFEVLRPRHELMRAQIDGA